MFRKLKIKRLEKHFAVLEELHIAFNNKEKILYNERMFANMVKTLKINKAADKDIQQAVDKLTEIHFNTNAVFLAYFTALSKATATLAPEIVSHYIELLEAYHRT